MRYNELSLRPAVPSLLAGIAVIVFLYVYGFGIERFRPESIRDMMLSLGHWGPLLYIALNIVRPLFFFPAIVLAVAGGLAFGPEWGAVYLIIGTVLGAALCFGAARFLRRGGLLYLLPQRMQLQEVKHQIEEHGFRTMLLLRIVPLLPWDAVSFMAGLSTIRFWPYIAATFAGSVPGAIAFSYLGNSLCSALSAQSWVVAVIAAACIIVPAVYCRSGER